MNINVTQEDINQGKRSRCFECPIALAMSRVFGFSVGSLGHEVFRPSNRDATLGLIPPEAMRFMRDFDNGSVVQPFMFEL